MRLQGYPFRVGFMPWSFFGSADYNAEATDPRRAYENHTGCEIEMIETFCEVKG